MTKTDTKALAAAIDAFEEEFPDLIWSLDKNGYLFIHGSNNLIVAHVNGYDVNSNADAFRICAVQIRRERARHSIAEQHAKQHAALMDAEYEPVRTVR